MSQHLASTAGSPPAVAYSHEDDFEEMWQFLCAVKVRVMCARLCGDVYDNCTAGT
jgi:hypothetical protein